MRKEIATGAFLANLSFFRGLPAATLTRLAAGTARRKLRRGEVLFREGELPTGLYALVFGRLKLVTHDAAGRETRADVIGAGHTFAEAMLFLDRPYIVRATALSDALVLHVGRDSVFLELQHTPVFARRVIGALAERVEWLVRERNDLAVGSAAQRFVAWLLRRRELAGASEAGDVVLPATKRVLAAHLGLSPEHLSRVLRELSAADLLTVRGRVVTVADTARLRKWQIDGRTPRNAAASEPLAVARRQTLATVKERAARPRTTEV